MPESELANCTEPAKLDTVLFKPSLAVTVIVKAVPAVADVGAVTLNEASTPVSMPGIPTGSLGAQLPVGTSRY